MKLQSDIIGGSYVQDEDCFKLHFIGVDTYSFFDYRDDNTSLILVLA